MFKTVQVWLIFALVLVSNVGHAHAADSNKRLRVRATLSIFDLQAVGSGKDQAAGSDELLKREISRAETQDIQIDLTNGQYAEVVFVWQEINLNVALFDPSGAKLIPADIQVTWPGPVSISILAEKSGIYRLQITTPVKQKISGKYEVKLGEPRLPTEADRNRVKAQSLIAAAQTSNTTTTKTENLIQASTLLRDAKDVNGEARVHLLLGDEHKAAGKREMAQANYDQAASIWNESSYSRGEAYAKIALGLLFRRSDLPRALTHYQQAELLLTQIGDRRGQADALYGRAFTLMLMGQTHDAINALQQTVSIRRAISDRMGEASALNMMADAYRLLVDYEKALDNYDQAAKALLGLEHYFLEASLINNKALLYDDQGNWQESKDEYARVLSLYEALLGKPLLSACQFSPSSQDAPICGAAAKVLINFGEAYNSLGQSTTALEEFDKSLAIYQALNDSGGKGSANFHLGYAQFLLGDHANALEYYDAALAIQTAAGNKKDVALTNTYKGMLHIARNEPALALKLYEKALSVLDAGGDMRSLAITLDKLGTAYSLLGNAPKASETYGRAVDLWRTIKDPDGESLTLSNMARAEQLAGNLALANQHSEATLHLVESLRTRLTSQQLRVSYFADRQDYYQLDVDLKMLLANSRNEPKHVDAALESNEKARARNLLDVLNEAGVARLELNNTSEARLSELIGQRTNVLGQLASKTKARTTLLNDGAPPQQIAAIHNDIAKLTETFDQVEARLRSKNPRLANLTKPQPSTASEIQQQLDADTLLVEYALGGKRSYVWVVAFDSIKGFELPARAQVEAAANRLVNSLTSRSRSGENEDPRHRQMRIRKEEADYSEASAALSKMVIGPIASMLGRKRLVVVADGALQYVPFSALLIPSSTVSRAGGASKRTLASSRASQRATVPLISQHEVVTLPSASVLALQRREIGNRKPAPLSVAILADPVFDADDERVTKAKTSSAGNGRVALKSAAPSTVDAKSPPKNLSGSESLTAALRSIGVKNISWLPFSRAEAEAILRFAPKNETFTALDFDASRATAASPSLAKYKILHIATHGVMDLEHPELSGVILSMVDAQGKPVDGYLRLHEIYNLNLPAELVVLSACQTGVGKQIKGEGLIALTRGFMYAGAKSVVASYWKVDDKATSELMAEFYKQMFVNKLKPASALRMAQIKISQQKRWNSPHYWAGFFLQGEWN